MRDEKFVTVGWVARRLGISDDRVRQLERSGALRCRRATGGLRIFAEDDVERFAREREARRGQRTGAA
jgi:excisionase family DNA binding protein